ncbi:MAG: sodium-dependent transporter [Ruminococcaceae bacterium]|nr:sodium-dependent transporter [Oscillospiraceae bacterium]
MDSNITPKKRGSFSGKIGFVLAAAGSAVGLGNIWRFPYLAAEYGGGIFLLVYLILAVTFGFALMSAEIMIGRKTGLSAIGAFKKLDKRFSFVGILASLVPVLVLPYYCVIGGWVVKYFTAFVSGNMGKAAMDGYFGDFRADTFQSMLFFAIFLGITSIIVLFGVEKGIEKTSKFLMPVLVTIIIGLSIYIMFQDGAMEGVIYYIKPDFSKFSFKTVLAAMGQLFYSMSLAMGIMITYGSYMKKEVSVESSVHQIEIFDTGVAFFAGLMIIPAVFTMGGVENLNAGPGLMFVTLPKVFDKMPGGAVIGAIFFVLVFFAALTSSVSLMETVVSILRDKFGIKRIASCLTVLGISLALGTLSALSTGLLADVKPFGKDFLDFFDYICNNILMPITALLTCILVGYIIKPKKLLEEAETHGNKFKAKKLFTVVIKYIAPICIILIFISSIFGIV